MPLRSFDALPADSRLWSFGCSRSLEPEEQSEFLARIDGFLDRWTAHGHPLDVGRDWRDGRLLLVAVDERTAPPSGCSIDALVRALKDEGERLDAQLVDNTSLWYRDPSGTLRRATRTEFAKAAASGEIDADTRVFDFTVTRLRDVLEGRWEVRAGDAWHARAFQLDATGAV